MLFVLSLAPVLNLARDVGRPFGGFLTYYAPLSASWNVEPGTPPWWPGLQAGLQYNDHLLTLAGQPFGWDQEVVYAAAHARGLEHIPVTVGRQGETVTITLPLSRFTLARFLDIQLPSWLISVMLWLLSFIVYRARPEAPLNRVFALACGVEAAFHWSYPPALFWHANDAARLFDLLRIVLFTPLAVVLVSQLALLFPEPSRFYHPLVLYPLYAIALIFALVYGVSRLLLWQGSSLSWVGPLDNLGYYGFSYLRLAGIAIFVARLTWIWIAPGSSRRQRRQVRILLLGFGVAALFIVFSLSHSLWGSSHGYFWNNVDLRYLFLAIPASGTIAILRYQTFHPPGPAFLIVPIVAFSGVAASIGVALWRTTMDSDYWTPFATVLLITLTVSLVWASQVRWRGYFGRLLHREQQNYHAVRRFGERLMGQHDLNQLPQEIAAELVSELGQERAAVWLWDGARGSFRLAGQAGQWPQALPDLPAPEGDMGDWEQPFLLQRTVSSSYSWLSPLHDLVEVIVPLRLFDEPMGFLALGKRWDEELVDEHDLTVIELIGQQAVLFLVTARQIVELRRVPRLVDEAQERERTKIAHELHDTIQQFLGRLPFFLEMSRMAAQDDPERAAQILQECIEDVEDAARTVRQIRHNLTASRVEDGLVEPLTHLVSRFRRRTGIEVELEAAPELDQFLAMESRHALYRLVQQALDNVAKHAGATRVSISLAYEEDRITFCIIDNGQGSSEQTRRIAQEQGSLGLRSMAARIENLGGEFVFISFPESGTEIRGWVPVI